MPLTRDEFYDKVTSYDNKTTSIENWVTGATSVVATVAMTHENLSKDDIVDALQTLAVVMPAELVNLAVGNVEQAVNAVLSE